MITNKGKEIIAKYMLGQAPAYATHIGIGCGVVPDSPSTVSYSVTNKQLTASVATLTTSVDHDFQVGDRIIVSGVDATFNGTYTVKTRPSATTFTYDRASASVASTSASGSATHDYSENINMAFEMTRVPISSMGYVNENGLSKLVLSSEIPTEYKYEITEVALWSAATNSAVTSSDSRILFTFASDEGWVLHNTSASGSVSPIIADGLSLSQGGTVGDINKTDAIFATYSNNSDLIVSSRKARNEGSRFLNHTLFMRGDTSKINSSYVVTASSTASADSHIHLDGRNFNLSQNSPNDQIKVALSIVPKVASNSVIPDTTRIVIEFLTSETNTSIGYARLKHTVKSTDLSSNNRYIVITKALKDLEMSSDFSWANVRMTRIYVASYKTSGDESSNTSSNEYYVVLDAIRFENISTPNPLYAMSGYAVVKTTNGYPISKEENTNNYIEFRLTLGVA